MALKAVGGGLKAEGGGWKAGGGGVESRRLGRPEAWKAGGGGVGLALRLPGKKMGRAILESYLF